MHNLFFKGFTIGILASAVIAALNIILTPIIVHNLGLESYGIIGIYTTWVMVFSIIDTAISKTAGREFGKLIGKNKDHKFVNNLLKTSEFLYFVIVILFLTLFIVLLTFIFFLELKFEIEISINLFFLLVLSGVCQLLSNFYSSCVIGLQRQDISSYIIGFTGVTRILSLIILLEYYDIKLTDFFLIQTMFFFFQILVSRLVLKKKLIKIQSKTKIKYDYLKVLIKKSMIMVGIGISGVFASYFDKIILSTFIPLKDFGLYSLAWIIASSMFLVAMPFSLGIEARLANAVGSKGKISIVDVMSKGTFIFYGLLIIIALNIIINIQEIIDIWLNLTSDIYILTKITIFMIIGSIFVSCSYALSSLMYCLEKSSLILRVNYLILIFYLPVLCFAIYKFNMLGAAIAWAFYGFLIYVIYLYLLFKTTQNSVISKILNINILIPLSIFFIIDKTFNYFIFDLTSDKLLIIFIIFFKIISALLILFIIYRSLYSNNKILELLRIKK
ncbi:hypothetical protein N8870_05275 [Alphaproteobacteria bacterium]|nr:hypothetical protein [Alphaproteobacteria bacterium]